MKFVKLCVIVFVENTFATLPRTTRGVAIVLGGDPKGKNFLYTNGNSVIIRDIAVLCYCYCDIMNTVIVHCLV